MPKYVFDTNLVISRRFDPGLAPETTYQSTVVLLELMTASNGLRERRAYEAAWREARKAGVLIVPTADDWLAAARVSFALAQGRKQQAGGKSPRLTHRAKQEIALDCLLAVSAARLGVTVLTLNAADFDYIRRHCKGLRVQTYPPSA